MHRRFDLYQFSLALYCIIVLTSSCMGVGMKQRHATYRKRHIPTSVKLTPNFLTCGLQCSNVITSESTETPTPMTTDLPDLLFTEEDSLVTTEISMTTTIPTTMTDPIPSPPPRDSRSLVTSTGMEITPGRLQFEELTKLIKQKRRQCGKSFENNISAELDQKSRPTNFTCEKLKLSSWLMDQLEKETTEVLSSYVQLIRNQNDTIFGDEMELLPDSRTERFVFDLISTFGGPVDKLLFYQFKKYTKSRSLQVSVPHVVTIQLEPRTHPEVVTGRTLFDPGFNMKLKFPFFHDELKVAVSTGPSFLAGVSVGLVVLGIKSLFAPFLIAMKYMMLSWYFKDMGPIDMVKQLAGPVLPAWMTGWRPLPPPPRGWDHSHEQYEPPKPYEFGGAAHGSEGKPTGLMGALTHLLPFTSQDQPPHFSGPSGMFQTGPRPTHYSGPSGGGFRATHYDGEGRTQVTHSSGFDGGAEEHHSEHEEEGYHGEDHQPHHTPAQDDESSGFKYVPPTAPVDADILDPFYSPLLSRIDSIFMHLGFTEEGCKERAVCSIYKFPVKYAPYSNLLSAQLSKHQSELKRPLSTSPKILRYFKYMKAAKDGQAALNCIELYPKCSNDTEKLTNLPMVKTFQQLTELMGTTGTGPSG